MKAPTQRAKKTKAPAGKRAPHTKKKAAKQRTRKPPAEILAKTAKPKAKRPSSRPKSAAAARPVYGQAALIADERALSAAVESLIGRDPKGIGHMLETAGQPPLRARKPGFEGLAFIVVSQQVSVASANAISGRLAKAFDPLDARAIRAASEEELRACGLSSPKMRTLRALSEAVETGKLDLEMLGRLPAEDAHAALCAIHGIGPWTADIFLLFCLGHPDAWPAGDLALQEAAKIALGLKKRPSAQDLEKIGERWRPHRGVAARMLWAYYKVVKDGRKGMMLA